MDNEAYLKNVGNLVKLEEDLDDENFDDDFRELIKKDKKIDLGKFRNDPINRQDLPFAFKIKLPEKIKESLVTGHAMTFENIVEAQYVFVKYIANSRIDRDPMFKVEAANGNLNDIFDGKGNTKLVNGDIYDVDTYPSLIAPIEGGF